MNISAIPGIIWDPEIKQDAIWPPPKPIPLSMFHAKLADIEIANYESAGFVELCTDPSVYAAGMFCIDKKKPRPAEVPTAL